MAKKKYKANIVIVEDESIVALDINNTLQRFGYNVSGIFSEGETLLEEISNLDIDLVLMDIKLQGSLDGIETAERIRSKYRIPVVLLTAFADPKTIERAKSIGPFGYIIKPFEARELHSTIEMALYRSDLDFKLWQSEEKYRKLFEDDLSANFVTDSNCVFIDCNQSFYQIFELDDDCSLFNFIDLFENREEGKRILEKIIARKRVELLELELHTFKKNSLVILANLVCTFNESGEFTELKGYLIDITQRKSLEKQLRQSQKMEAIGRLAGGVAHDFNNILTVIFGYISLIEETEGIADSVSAEIAGLKAATVRASSLTRQLLAFSRRQMLQPVPLKPDIVVSELEKMFRRLINEDINIVLKLYAADCIINIDPGQFEQVLINLVVNSRDAMKNGGTIYIHSEKVDIHKEKEMLLGKIRKGSYYRLEVKDEGEGIAFEHLNRIFDPFFTTKSEDKGTGLGLSTVYGIIKQSEGNIELDSKEGHGTRFVVYLPLSDSPKPKSENENEIVLEKTTATIMLVEDDRNVRDLVGLILKQADYHVLVADDPNEALLLSENSAEKIDILVTDLIMPQMNGDELAEKILKDRPDIKVLIMSGYPDKSDSIKTFQERGWKFIQKPFDNNHLLKKISEVFYGSN
ncbi:MAG: response regulator [Spirochaetales bacterium]|nr:response regulator [Spirochaetales bacterium]